MNDAKLKLEQVDNTKSSFQRQWRDIKAFKAGKTLDGPYQASSNLLMVGVVGLHGA